MKNAKKAFAKNALLISAATLLLSGGVVLAQDQPAKASDTVYEVGNGVTAPKMRHTPMQSFPNQHAGRKSTAWWCLQ